MSVVRRRARVRRASLWLAFGVLIALTAPLLWHEWREARIMAWQINFMPAEFGHVTLSHFASSDLSHDIGPGGNHALFLAFDLPAETANGIATSGMVFLARAKENGHDEVLSWQPTPVDQTHRRFVCRADGRISGDPSDVPCTGILDFATRYIPLESGSEAVPHAQAADSALFAPGGYYALTRLGLILVDPARRRAYYASNG